MTHDTIRHLRARSGLTLDRAAGLLGVDLHTVERWEADPDLRADAAEAPPWATLALRALAEGFTPPDFPTGTGGTMDARQAQDLLHQLDLTQTAFARLIGTSGATVRKGLAHDGASTRRRMNPGAARLLWWMAQGWRPPGWGSGPVPKRAGGTIINDHRATARP